MPSFGAALVFSSAILKKERKERAMKIGYDAEGFTAEIELEPKDRLLMKIGQLEFELIPNISGSLVALKNIHGSDRNMVWKKINGNLIIHSTIKK